MHTSYNSSEALKTKHIRRKRTPVKSLRHENSTTVWNELALYREQCQQLETCLLAVEEERDTLKASCLRSQTSIAELRTQLQQEKNDLERKLSAIAKVEDTSLSSSVQSSSQLELKISELEGVISELRHENATLQSQHSSAEKELFKLREDAVQMQTQIMELTHKQSLQTLQMLSKATMTEKESPCHYDSISVTNSATQVDCPPLKPDVRDAHVSPIRIRNTLREMSTQTSTPAVEKPLRAHRRSHSEGDSLFYKKKAKDAYTRVKKISKQLQEISLSQHNTDNKSPSAFLAGQEENSSTDMMKHCTGCTCACREEPSTNNQKANGPTQPHGSHTLLQQQVKVLQKKLRTLSRQLSTAGIARQSLADSLEVERREKKRARSEVKELSVRLEGMKTVVQSLQTEIRRVSAVNQQLQQKVTLSSETKKGRTEADWKRIESEKQVLHEKCSALSGSVKALEDEVQQKTNELTETHDRCGRMERDLRQKRQLLDSQRDKMKMLAQQAADDKAKAQSMESEVQSLRESSGQSRHKVEALRMQLSRQKEDNSKVMRLLANCQEELADTLQHLSDCQRECEKKKQLLVHVRQSCEQEVKRVQQKHAETVESEQCKHAALERSLRQQLREKDDFLQEHRQFLKEFTVVVKAHLKQNQPEKRDEDRKNCTVVSSRVREIAKSTLCLSDLDIDELFSDSSHDQQQDDTRDPFLISTVEDHLSKLPFASSLVKHFMNMLRLKA